MLNLRFTPAFDHISGEGARHILLACKDFPGPQG
jgi:hypothetical protein